MLKYKIYIINMNILIYNVSYICINNILYYIKLVEQNIDINIYTNINYLNSQLINYIALNYVSDIDDTNLESYIINNNISFVITNVITKYINEMIRRHSCSFKIICVNKQPNPNIYYYKDIPRIFDIFKNSNNEEKNKNKIKMAQMNSIIKCNNNLNVVKQNTNVNANIKVDVNATKIVNKEPKETYREICVKYLELFRNVKIPNIQINLVKEAVLVEFRILPHLEVLIRNSILNLGSNWSYTVVCGNNNYSYIEAICKNISNNITIININCNNLTQNEYNNLLCTELFWNLFHGEKLLIYQEDTCIFRNNIDDYLKYDYIGAPFNSECVTPINVGNGGFSLRTKSIMKHIIKLYPPEQFMSNSKFVNDYKNSKKLSLYPEDIYFSQSMQLYSVGIVSTYEDAKKFSSETIFTPNCLGMHCMWFCNKNWEKYICDYFITKLSYNLNNYFDCYIIHCDEFIDRNDNITNISTLMKNNGISNINIINSVNTTNIKLDIMNQEHILRKYDQKLRFSNTTEFIFYKCGQLGCYIGHHMAVKQILSTKRHNKYSVILEDDAILCSNFTEEVSNILNYFESHHEPFDIIFLGSLNDNQGTKLHNNIYKPSNKYWLFGAHGLLINNSSSEKIYSYNCNILNEIDNHYKLLFNDNKLNIYYINQRLVSKNKELYPSYIKY